MVLTWLKFKADASFQRIQHSLGECYVLGAWVLPRRLRRLNAMRPKGKLQVKTGQNSQMNDFTTHLETLCSARQTTLPKRLVAPGPDLGQLEQLLASAASAPDHGQILPWRFIIVPTEARILLADQFASALIERDSQALPHQMEQAREKAFRAPLLMLVVVDAERGDPDVDVMERMVSAGCAIQNVLLMATAQGFGSALTSGKALKSHGLRALFGLATHDHAVCFISIGTVQSCKPARSRPSPYDFTSQLTLNHGLVQGFKALVMDTQ